jgi:glycosyltransferase involved in cell wall biosynthesis
MKKLLFVIDSLTIGGAEKSLISLLSLIDCSIYEIDLLLFKQGEDFESYIPNYVNVLPVPQYFSYLNRNAESTSNNFKFLTYRIKTSVNLRLNNYKKKSLHSEQVVFRSIQNTLQPIEKIYDIAIAYSQGMPTYFVANKVTAKKKLAWINTDYVNTLYDKNYDYESYKKIDKIITVSRHTRDSISRIRNEYRNKVDMILDIVNPHLVYKMADEFVVSEFEEGMTNILTVGRLVSAKAYEKAIEVASLLKESGYKFRWYAIGDGPEKEHLRQLIQNHQLEQHFVLLGKKLNPYPYMKMCDLYVQTSLKEGFGLTICEAKILRKPITCTNFPTSKEIINHNIDGLIVEHDSVSIFNGVKKYLDDRNFLEKVKKQLNRSEPYNSLTQLQKFYSLVES